MSEEEVKPDGTETTEPDEVETEAGALAVDMGGNKMVPLSALIGAKRELKAVSKKVKELEPVAARVTELDEKLGKAQPIIDALVSSPKLRAEALRIAQGTRTSADTTEQPDDPDASAYAEDMGFYLADGVTVDVARAQRVLARLDQRHGRQTDDRIRPLAGVTLSQKANENLREAAGMTDDNGVPLATLDSIKEVAGQLPQHLLADPKVIDLVLNSAIGLDRRKNRTPKAPDEPLFMESAGGGRGRRPDALDPELKGAFERLGIDHKQGQAAVRRLEEGAVGRKGIALGVK